ncbi:class I SAM-dependent methyltransferase [Nocardioides sp. IC4_145]|uniref:class I SAM-dependent methyltransferase n=1 Tax=Nocardioides sp. IC4_145 TaxID=2714037 RepID=UPI00140E3F00|nr:class I SAM-dependent methyltransferase [Nocardioides sp. IC4_145]NHC23983.1 class I SAM-dependent methyltransferase [Nocardioides sp. IC4_145]
MTEIERRIEARHTEPDYQAWSFSDAARARGRHRDSVGGKWDEMGQLQLDFLLGQGLEPSMRLLDVGCGSLRAGRLLVPYLDPGHYYGIDIGHDIVQAGYDLELDDAARERLPVQNLRITDRFDADFGVPFDMAIAQSVFTHVSLNHIRLCLYRVAKVMKPGGKFYATFSEKPKDYPVDGTWGRAYTERNVYWYYRRDLRWAAERTPFEFRYLGAWGHARNQKMVEYTRLPD